MFKRFLNLVWYLSAAGLEECSKGNTNTSADDIIKEAVNLDLKAIGEKRLPDGLSGKGKTDGVDGPFVLQVVKVRNVSVPREAECSTSDATSGSGGHRLLRLTLTDGHAVCLAADMDNITGLSADTPPGTKLRLTGKVPINQNFLLLTKNNCKLLGGRVEKLYEQWQMKQMLSQHSRAAAARHAGSSGAPVFTPFGQKRPDNVDSPTTNTKQVNFKSLDAGAAPAGGVAKKKELDEEFERQRRSQIAAVLRERDCGSGDAVPVQSGGGGMRPTGRGEGLRSGSEMGNGEQGRAAVEGKQGINPMTGHSPTTQQQASKTTEQTKEISKSTRESKLGQTKEFGQDKDVAKLVDMGFSVDQAHGALRESHGNVETAANILLTQQDVKKTGAVSLRSLTSAGGRELSVDGSESKLRAKGFDNDRRSQEIRFEGKTKVDSDGQPHEGGRRDGRSWEEGRNSGRSDGRPRRGGRKDEDDDDYGHTRPSAPATLFDFVTSKIPNSAIATSKTEAPEKSTDKSVESKDPPRTSISSNHSARNGDVTSAATAQAPPQQNLPPRLQRKLQMEEEDKLKQSLAKYHVPYGGGGGKRGGADEYSDQRGDISHTARHYDIHSRGTVSNRALWTDENRGVDRGEERGNPNSRYGGNRCAPTNQSTQDRNSSGRGNQSSDNYGGNSRDVVSNRNRGKRTGEDNIVNGNDKMDNVVHGMSRLNTNTSGSGYGGGGVPGGGRNVQPLLDVQTPYNASSNKRKNASENAATNATQQASGSNDVQWRIGDACMALYHEDKQFYQVEILAVNRTRSSLNVLFVEYGNVEEVSLQDVRELPIRNNLQPSSWQQPSNIYHQPTTAGSVPIMSNSVPSIVYQQQQQQPSNHGNANPSMIYQQPPPHGASGLTPNHISSSIIYQPSSGAPGVLYPTQGTSVVLCAVPVTGQSSSAAMPGIRVQPIPQQMAMFPGPGGGLPQDGDRLGGGAGGNSKRHGAQQVYAPPSQRK